MILASHSRLAIPPETYFLDPLLKRLPASRPLSTEETTRAVAIITGHGRWPDMGIDTTAFAYAAAALHRPLLHDIVEIVYRTHLTREGKSRWGDKTPAYIRIVPQLVGLYPGARFIHLVRDGRDVAKSFQSVGWYGPLLNRNMDEWLEAVRLAARWQQTDVAERMLTVRYEDLVRDTEPTARRICDFLGEDFEPAMLGWQDNVERLVPRRELPIHAKLQRKPNLDDIERWRREMSFFELMVAEAFIGTELAATGYPCRFRNWPVMAPVRLYCRLVAPLVHALQRRLGPRARNAASVGS